MAIDADGFAGLAVEHWRLIRVLGRLVERLPEEAQGRVQAQVRFAATKLQSLAADQSVRLEVFDGRRFDANLPVTALNADDFPPDADLVIADTVEPAVLRDGQLVQMGKVLLSVGI